MGRTRHLCIVAGLLAAAATAQGVRDHTRPSGERETAVSESQAIELTLTVIETTRRPLQTWVRTAGELDASGRLLTATVSPAEADLLRPGQRVRVFPPESKSSMTQAKVAQVMKRGDRAVVEATLAVAATTRARYYVMEIIVERGMFLAVSNEAIIEEGDRQVVYLERSPGHYEPRDISTGLRGELYSEIHHGLETGDRVVTFGSFFIDAEHKLKSSDMQPSDMGGMDHAHNHH